VKTWFRCPSMLGVHPKLLGAGWQACLLYVVLRGLEEAKGEPLTDADLSPHTLWQISRLPPKGVAKALDGCIRSGVLVHDIHAGIWRCADLLKTEARRPRKHGKEAVTRNVTVTATVTPTDAAAPGQEGPPC